MLMLKDSKLDVLFESLMTRYRLGSFLVGDQIRFLDSIEKSEIFKNLPVTEKEILQDIINQQEMEMLLLKLFPLIRLHLYKDLQKLFQCLSILA